jgi:DNA-binding phage protein
MTPVEIHQRAVYLWEKIRDNAYSLDSDRYVHMIEAFVSQALVDNDQEAASLRQHVVHLEDRIRAQTGFIKEIVRDLDVSPDTIERAVSGAANKFSRGMRRSKTLKKPNKSSSKKKGKSDENNWGSVFPRDQ